MMERYDSRKNNGNGVLKQTVLLKYGWLHEPVRSDIRFKKAIL
jgi:hypothetical protein